MLSIKIKIKISGLQFAAQNLPNFKNSFQWWFYLDDILWTFSFGCTTSNVHYINLLR